MPTMQYPESANANGLSYEPGSEERKVLKTALAQLENVVADIPSVINGEHIFTGRESKQYFAPSIGYSVRVSYKKL